MSSPPPPSLGRIFVFWYPMAVTWLMMSTEGPFLAAVIARLADPKPNLAAFGVAFAVAILVESPVIMVLSASTALVRDAASLRKLRSFTYALNAAVTAAMLALLLTGLWDVVATRLIGLPAEVARLTEGALLLLLPWPGAIGYRRFYQGLLIRGGQTRRVAYGTVVRLASMALTGLGLWSRTELPGAWVGAAALSAGVVVEALASRWMSARVVRELLRRPPSPSAPPLTHARIAAFYWPLALTSLIGLAVQPIATFFMGRARLPLESLAVLPVLNALTFVFRSMGLSYQEVAIALLADDRSHRRPVVRFAWLLAAGSSLALALLAFTPLATWWYRDVSGLSAELTAHALGPTRILALLPALSVVLSLQRAILVDGRATRAITRATAIEVGGIVAFLLVAVSRTTLVGVTAAALAFLVGRVGANLSLVGPCLRALRRDDGTPGSP